MFEKFLNNYPSTAFVKQFRKTIIKQRYEMRSPPASLHHHDERCFSCVASVNHVCVPEQIQIQTILALKECVYLKMSFFFFSLRRLKYTSGETPKQSKAHQSQSPLERMTFLRIRLALAPALSIILLPPCCAGLLPLPVSAESCGRTYEGIGGLFNSDAPWLTGYPE